MYRNFGDRHFFDRGRLIDTDNSDTVFPMLYCEPCPGMRGRYRFAELIVDTEDPWIDRRAVEEPGGDAAMFAAGLVDYYGPEEFGAGNPPYGHWECMTRDEIMDILQYRDIDRRNVSFSAAT